MDRETAAAFAAENMKTIFAYALHRVSKREDAEDLAGDIIVAVLENAHTLQNKDAFFGWFWSVAANTVRKYYRKKSRALSAEVEDVPAADDISDGLIRQEEAALLRRELSLLAKEYRECTVAYYFDGLSCGEIGKKYGISVEMVKYYLYKTRRILKEGLTMTRAYGEKSYKPATFHFSTIFDGSYNAEYRNLFDRKLPGNILYCAYYTPVTAAELSVELGVAAVYLEDEIALLQKYDLMSKMQGGKFQTKLCIFTREYDRELYRTLEAQFTGKLGEILASVRTKLPQIRGTGFRGCAMEDNRLLWALYFDLLRRGWMSAGIGGMHKDLYDGARGVNFAEDYDREDDIYAARAFAGYYGLRKDLAACFADFGVLEEKNYIDGRVNWNRLQTLADESIHGGADAPLVYLKEPEVGRIFREILAESVTAVGLLYREMADCAVRIMKSHAPAAAAEEIPAVIGGTLFHRTVGLMGKMAVDSGELCLPEDTDDLPYAVYLYETERKETAVGYKADHSC